MVDLTSKKGWMDVDKLEKAACADRPIELNYWVWR